MVRMLLLGLVVVIATLGGSYAAMQMPRGASHAEADAGEKTEVVKIDPISVPVVREGKIQGYVIGRFAFSAPASEIRKDKDALILYVSEAIFLSVYEEEEFDFSTLKIIEVDKGEKTEVVKVDNLSVPVVRAGKIQGYVIGRFAFSAPASEIRKDKDALILYVSEAIFLSVYEEEEFDFSTLKIIEVDKLIARAVAKANARIGRPMIAQLFVESMNFLAHDAVRCQPAK